MYVFVNLTMIFVLLTSNELLTCVYFLLFIFPYHILTGSGGSWIFFQYHMPHFKIHWKENTHLRGLTMVFGNILHLIHVEISSFIL